MMDKGGTTGVKQGKMNLTTGTFIIPTSAKSKTSSSNAQAPNARGPHKPALAPRGNARCLPQWAQANAPQDSAACRSRKDPFLAEGAEFARSAGEEAQALPHLWMMGFKDLYNVLRRVI